MGRIDPSHDCGPRFFKPSEKSASVHRHSVDSMRARLTDPTTRRSGGSRCRSTLRPSARRLGQNLPRPGAPGDSRRPARPNTPIYSLMLEAGPLDPIGAGGHARDAAFDAVHVHVGGMLGARRREADPRTRPMAARCVSVLTDRGRGVVRTVNPPFTRALVALEASLDRPVDEVRAILLEIVDAIDRADAGLAAVRRDLRGKYYELVVSCGDHAPPRAGVAVRPRLDCIGPSASRARPSSFSLAACPRGWRAIEHVGFRGTASTVASTSKSRRPVRLPRRRRPPAARRSSRHGLPTLPSWSSASKAIHRNPFLDEGEAGFLGRVASIREGGG